MTEASPITPVERPERPHFGVDVREWLCGVDPFYEAILKLAAASGSDAYLVGGAVRDYFFGVCPRDIDLMAPNDDQHLHAVLLDHASGMRTNRHGNVRFQIDGRSVDVMRPRNFYRQFATVESAIAYFDISINALGVRLSTGEFFDAWRGVEDIRTRRVHTVAQRWDEASDFECVHLMLRLLRYASRYQLRLADPQALARNLHKIETVDWQWILQYHPWSRSEARSRLISLAKSDSSAWAEGRLSVS
jgi:tRNA nucleotidyltransferase/poly(A) polymerase